MGEAVVSVWNATYQRYTAHRGMESTHKGTFLRHKVLSPKDTSSEKCLTGPSPYNNVPPDEKLECYIRGDKKGRTKCPCRHRALV